MTDWDLPYTAGLSCRCSRCDEAKMNQNRACSDISFGRAPGKLLMRLCSESSWEVPSPQVEDAPNPWHSRPKTCAFTCMKICFKNVNTYGAPDNSIRVEVFLGEAYCCLGLLWKHTHRVRWVGRWLDGWMVTKSRPNVSFHQPVGVHLFFSTFLCV